MMIPEPSPRLALFVAQAIELRRRAELSNGRTPPAGMAELRDLFAAVASGRQEPTSSEHWRELLEDLAVTPKLLKRGQVAIELGCSERTVDRLIAAGALPAVTLGDQLIRVRVSDVDAYINGLASARKGDVA